MKIKNRRSIRLQEYDYSSTGAYFVTICAQNRECLFGNIIDGEMKSNEYGRIVLNVWHAIPEHFDNINLDEFIVMPNHIHGIIIIMDNNCTGTGIIDQCMGTGIIDQCTGTACRAPTIEQFGKPVSGSLPTIIRSFKSAVTKRINESRMYGHGMPCPNRPRPNKRIWQRNYYERIIRDETELNNIRQYIIDNPKKWESDCLCAGGQ